MAQLTAGAKANRRDFLLTDDFAQSYGALSENPTKEDFYKEFFNGGANNVARAQNFRDSNPIVAMLARNSDIRHARGAKLHDRKCSEDGTAQRCSRT